MKGLKRKVPDGGWGWIIVGAAAMTNMVNQYLISVFGLVFGQQLESMGYGTFGAALVMNMNTMITNFSGFVTGPVLRKYSPRTVTVVGVLFSAIGLVTVSFSRNLVEIILTYSILTGLGLGLIMPATFMAVNSYFDTRRQQAVGLSMAGTCIGQMLMPHVITFLLNEYGFRGTTLILGGISLNGLAASLLFHPVEWHMKQEEDADVEKEKETLMMTEKNSSLNKAEGAETNKTKPVTLWKKFVRFFDFDLLKDVKFIHIILGVSLVYTCSVSFSMLFPFFLRSHLGLPRERVAICMTVLSTADVIGRITVPMITGPLKFDSRQTFIFGSLILALARTFFALQTNYVVVVFGALLCGYTRAATLISQNLAVSEYVGSFSEEKIAASVGISMIAKGILVLTFGQFLGWIRDETGSFPISIFSQCVVLYIVFITWLIEIYISKRNRRKANEKIDENLSELKDSKSKL